MANLSAPVNLPSVHRLHLWGQSLNASLGQPRSENKKIIPGSTQCQITLTHPLGSLPDEIVKAPSVWQRRSPDTRVMSHLFGAGTDSPRLRSFDRTQHQPPAVTRDTSYVTDYCLPVDKRWQALPRTALGGASAQPRTGERLHRLEEVNVDAARAAGFDDEDEGGFWS